MENEKYKLENIDEAIASKKELDAIWSVYKKQKDCKDRISITCQEYGLTLDCKAAAIIDIVEDYYRIKSLLNNILNNGSFEKRR